MQTIQLHGINPVIPFYVQCGGYLLWWMSYNCTGFGSRRSRGWGLSHHHCHQYRHHRHHHHHCHRHHHHDHAYQWQEQQKHQQKQQGVDETRGRLLWEPRETKRTIFLANPCNHQHHHRHHKKLKETSPIIIITYLIFVIFCTPAHIEAWKKYAKKCVNSRQNPSCNKTAEFHFGEYLLFEWLYLVLGWYVWYFKSTNIAQSQETSLNTVPLAFLAENCTPA